MSIYRRNYWTDTAGGGREFRTAKRFTIEVRHPVTGKIVRKLGPRDRKSAKVMESQLIQNLERGLSGLEDPYREHRGEPIRDVIAAYIANLTTEEKDPEYIDIARERLTRLATEAGWRTIYDASQRTFEKWRTKTKESGYLGKPTKAKTLNQFLATANHFFKWCDKTNRIGDNPLRRTEKVRELHNDRFRRAATPDELTRFLAKLPSDDLRRFYTFLAYTALRRASLTALRWEDMNLDADPPTVTVRGEHNKVRRKQDFPLRRDLARMMKAARDGAEPKDKVFPRLPTLVQHRAYLAAAGIPFDDGAGQDRLDLHAFRKTLQAMLEDAGVDVREASMALGHLHLSTTLKSYRAKRAANPDAAVEKLPKLIVKAGKGKRR